MIKHPATIDKPPTLTIFSLFFTRINLSIRPYLNPKFLLGKQKSM